MVRALEDRRLAPGAPGGAEDVAHLAEGGVGAGGGDDRLLEVRVGLGGAAELGERGFDRTAVASGAQRLDALDLLLLERGVDAQDLERRLVLLLIAVYADDDALLGLDLGLVAVGGVGDLALHEVLLDRRDDAAEPRDPIEVVVGL